MGLVFPNVSSNKCSLHLDDVDESEGLLDEPNIGTLVVAASPTTTAISENGGLTTVRLPIVGMTCQSCVKSIESNLSTKPGVHRIRVQLSENAGYIDYDARLTDVHQLAEHIDDMGFECPIGDATPAATATTDSSTAETFKIHIDGMTCQSCVRNIEQKIGVMAGVKHISVDLAGKEATVALMRTAIDADAVADAIEDMGFEAFVKTAAGGRAERAPLIRMYSLICDL